MSSISAPKKKECLPRTQLSSSLYSYMFCVAERGEPLPASARQQFGIGSPEEVAPLVVFLASDAAAGITGQAIGLGGDKLSLWAHPHEVAVAYHEGGWSAGGIAEVWGTSVGQRLEPYGIPFFGVSAGG